MTSPGFVVHFEDIDEVMPRNLSDPAEDAASVSGDLMDFPASVSHADIVPCWLLQESGKKCATDVDSSNFSEMANDTLGTLLNGSQVPTTMELPLDMQFSRGSVLALVGFGVLMLISTVGNLTVLITLHRKQRQRRSRVNLLLTHLAVADLLVTFLMMPLEVGWTITVSWWADDASCRIMAFFRIIGLYLSSFILVCISLDRYYAVIHPLSVRDANRRVKIMLQVAWFAAILCSSPQLAVFRLRQHPVFTWYYQCVTFDTFRYPSFQLAYNLFVMIAMYGFPLVVIVVTYGAIVYEVTRKSQEYNAPTKNGHKEISLRRSGPETLNRARSKTLRMTIIMVAVFILCWTPYYIICLWFWLDFHSAQQLDILIQKGLFIFASSNSCMNPLVYGFFMVRCACLGRRTQENFDELLEVVASIRHYEKQLYSSKGRRTTKRNLNDHQ